MKRIYHFLVIVVLVVFIASTPATTHAKVYASQLKITNPDGSAFDGNFSDGTGALLSFILNDTASTVTVDIKDASTGQGVAQILAGARSRGLNSVTWDGSGSEAGKRYLFTVTAEQPNASSTDWTVFFDSGDIDIFTRGCDVVTDMNSSLFGLFFAPNTGGPLQKGITIYNSDGSFHDPFLVAADIGSGGTIDWGGGTQSMYSGVLDDEGRFYVSAVDFGEIRRLNRDHSLTTVITGLTKPKGLYLVGTGAERVLYICDDSTVVRAAIGNEDVFSGTVELVGQFSKGLPRNIALDDDGAMYVTFRSSNDFDSEPVGFNKYDISGNLPVTDDDAVWFLMPEVTFRITDLEFDHGSDRTTSTDDILYYATRAGDGVFDDGLWRIEDINFPFPQVLNLVDEQDLYGFDDSANINDRAAIALDAAGNMILLENSNEHVFFLSPPGEGPTNSFTTTSPGTVSVEVPVSVEPSPESNTVGSYRLEANFPNPFNPTTTIRYELGSGGFTTLRVFNLKSELISELVNRHQPAGEYSVTWNGRDDAGQAVASGVYILVLNSGKFTKSVRMTLMK
ncbi:MAG: FlgD immunoglobulin-like domain containing protein [bacterium]